MEKQEYIHFEVEGVIAPDKIACTRTPVNIANVTTTTDLDLTTCPMCRIAMIHRAMTHMERSNPKAR